ncbi:MAG TPA: hypothetical protein VJO16_01655 [Candidatus Acidoferrum sp.]|nr:hypothetical protein [Candidatus Acidoferrum sp.]
MTMRILSRILLILFLSETVAGSDAAVSFCDLVRNPERFNAKEVTIRATYRYGFEWEELYCLDCLDKGKAWLEIPADIDDASRKALKRAPKGAGIVDLTVIGTFMSGNTYGHSNGYQHKFVAKEISDVAVIVKGMKSPAEEKQGEKQWACGGTNPK